MTDVHFQPVDSASGGGVRSTQLGGGVGSIDPKLRDVNLESAEMAAFEKGRMQGEMEAIRRMENETQLKAFPVDQQAVAVQQPDVVEINRLTWLQRGAALLGELTMIAALVLTIVWIQDNRSGTSWSNDDAGNNIGSSSMWNTGFLCAVIGLFFLSQAILLYRVLPINTNPWLNRGLYIFNYCCAITCFCIELAALIKTPSDTTFWGPDTWCFALAFSSVALHFLYSVFRTLIERRRPVDYETWTETNNKVTLDSAEQRRDHSTFNQAGRTVYTSAPIFVPRTGANVPPANANVGAQVPVAPGNAPRWAENPNTHSEDYFLLPRAKWAIVSYWAIGASILMILTACIYASAAGHDTWAQGTVVPALRENSGEAWIVGSLALMVLATLMLVSYAAMPPRTTLVKNGILSERRSSVSHNAETRLGPTMV